VKERIHVMGTHMDTNRGPVIGGWRAAYMPPLHYPALLRGLPPTKD